ncbi:glycerol-3-phosphate ABC transporter ATP-binding protein [Natronococcus pandeyae]|uniref:ABC-type D-xylose/L-arabinose transporter n=1 Tax=Natronococcus pandeyae TaxID=2055836 RepID=A0A8J8TPE8_9EURY|nr:ABC transporter ATP-binding protein [Natronococcus pandeyae]TYL37358.1 glycerol-3-phosphate ABC transporter ATP-binding protein [Natronococcus pandeyae]
MASIALENVTKRFDDVTAVDGIDLSVTDGEFLVFVGPSGCGKSTTLRLIAGLETATSGSVAIGDTDVTDRDPSERNVSMVFQNYALFPHMTARENITFGMTASGSYANGEIGRLVDDAAATLDIEGLLDRKPAELSGGEKQRVAMGRSLVRDPEVFLMDEPLSNLDAKLRVEMRRELTALHEEFGTTTVYVTHDQTEAMTLGDRVAVMNNGRIEQIDAPQRLYDYPATQFVAEFIGSPAMNLLPVEIEERGDHPHAVTDAASISLRDGPELDALGQSRATLGIRPKYLSVVGDGDSVDGDTVDLEVDLVESMGDTLVVHGRAGTDHLRALSYDAHLPVEEGDRVSVTYETDRIHLFDRDTGEAIYHAGLFGTDADSGVRTHSIEGRPAR